MSDHSASLFVGEDEDVPSRHRAVLEEDSSGSDWELENLKHGNSTLFSPEESDQNDEGKGPLYCVCRRPERGAMLGCDGDCEDWFHEDCLDISKNDWVSHPWLAGYRAVAKTANRTTLRNSSVPAAPSAAAASRSGKTA